MQILQPPYVLDLYVTCTDVVSLTISPNGVLVRLDFQFYVYFLYQIQYPLFLKGSQKCLISDCDIDGTDGGNYEDGDVDVDTDGDDDDDGDKDEKEK